MSDPTSIVIEFLHDLWSLMFMRSPQLSIEGFFLELVPRPPGAD